MAVELRTMRPVKRQSESPAPKRGEPTPQAPVKTMRDDVLDPHAATL